MALESRRRDVDAAKVGDLDKLLDAARAGDRAALAALYDRFHHQVLRYFTVRSGPDAADLASETWVSVAASISRYPHGGDEFAAWLFTIANRRLSDHRRRWSRRPEYLRDAVPEVGTEHDLGAELAVADAMALVRRLKPDQAEAVTLRIVADLDVGQVADIMGLSEGNVRVLTHRGLAKLRELLVTPIQDAAMKGVS